MPQIDTMIDVVAGKHVGIPFARDSRGERYDRAAIDREPPPYVAPLYCDGCRIRVVAVHSAPYTVNGTVHARTSHYRKYQGLTHQPGCRYDFEHQARTLLAECRGTVEKNGEQYRLLLPDDRVTRPPRPRPAPGRPRAGQGPRLVVHRTDRIQHGQALTSARRIARLLHHFDHDPAAVGRFHAVHQGQIITWPHFFYTADHVGELVARLTAGPLPHPVAVTGRIRRHGTASSGTSFYIAGAPLPADLDGVAGTIEPRLWTQDPAVHADLTAAQHWLGYGRWELFPRTSPRWLQLWVHGPWNYTTSHHPPTQPYPGTR